MRVDHGGAVLVMWLEVVLVQMMLCRRMSSELVSDSVSVLHWTVVIPGPQRWHLVGEDSDSLLSISSNSRGFWIGIGTRKSDKGWD